MTTFEQQRQAVLEATGVDVGPFERCAASLRAESLATVACAFTANITNLRHLLALLDTLAHFMSAGLVVSKDAAVSVAERMFKGLATRLADRVPPEELAAAMMGALRTDPLSGGSIEVAVQRPDELQGVREMFADMLRKDETVSAASRVLPTSAVSGAWTAFECLVTDLWVVSLNNRPLTLGQRALTAAPADAPADGLTGKQVSVQMLARHGFDLRNCMGTLLKPKFDLTSLANIRKAYAAAFGKDAALEAALNSQRLNLLEASRHVIVHRAGVVDEEFARRTRNMGFGAKVGDSLSFDGKAVASLVNAAVQAGCAVLSFVDSWLVSNPA